MSSYFDEAAATWDSPDKVERSRALAEAIADAVPLDPDWHALDYGCGTGQLTWALGTRLAHVTLADVSEGMLAVARLGAARDPERYEVVRLDLVEGPLPEPVHLAYTSMALHHIPDVDAALRGLRDSVLPGGWVALADLSLDPENHFHDDHMDVHHGLDRHALADKLKALGFADVATATAATLIKPKDGVDHEHEVFLVTGRRTG